MGTGNHCTHDHGLPFDDDLEDRNPVRKVGKDAGTWAVVE